VPYPLYEITASGITHPWETAAEAGPNRLGALYTQRHYGSVDIDWAARSLRLALRDSNGAEQRSQHIGFDELKGKT
jgi:alkaline phosphatase D